MTEVKYAKRSPAAAVTLSMLCLGLGQIYCGRLAAGLALMLAETLPIVLVMVPLITNNVNVVFLLAVMLPSVFWACLYCYGATNSYQLAKRLGSNYELKDYNRGIVYALFVATNIVGSLAVSPAVTVFVREQVAEGFYGANDNMNPTILRGDRFLVNKLVQRKLPQRGDIVTFLNPENRDMRCVRRVVGLPGDTVAIRGNDVFVNGQKLKHEPIVTTDSAGTPAGHADNITPTRSASEGQYETNAHATYQIQLATADSAKAVDYPETKVPPSHCFVLGDNRSQVEDSRRFGFVPLGDILGKAQYIYWPAQHWSRFGPIDAAREE